MYFPYLRGRQFELIALRELVEKDVLSGRIRGIKNKESFSYSLCRFEFIRAVLLVYS